MGIQALDKSELSWLACLQDPESANLFFLPAYHGQQCAGVVVGRRQHLDHNKSKVQALQLAGMTHFCRGSLMQSLMRGALILCHDIVRLFAA